MADFKVSIAHKGKAYQKESTSDALLGMSIGQAVKGEILDLPGYELTITGGSDKCGFPMRSGIKGRRAKLNLLGGVGMSRSLPRGTRKRTTVCGSKITDQISQVNVKVTKEGAKKIESLLGGEEEPAAGEAAEKKDAPAKEGAKS